ncbi:MAG: hypothetical protein DRR19_23140 [Candidatus Parabeggiatoa sp. nov. 1]|nr:MAG: hypothetical protein DRR19_23140 [Gammaproteobacteria bacterium]
MLLFRLLFVFFVLFFGVQASYADVCYTQNITTLDEVRQAQECLEREIRESIDIARRYERYTEDVVSELKSYSMLRAKCKKYDILLSHRSYRYSHSLERQRDRYCELAESSKIELRKVERRDAVLGALYSKFKLQIMQLQNELELVELEYRYNIRGQ